jgi:CHAD domain-containing protein
VSAHATTVMQKDLAGFVRRQLHAMLKRLPRARRGHARAVHQARVASRRLREALPVAGAIARGELSRGLARDVRKLTRALGAVREMDVALQEFDTDAGLRAWSPVPVERVRRHLAEERERREHAMHAKVGRINLQRLEDRTEALAARVERGAATAPERVVAARLQKRAHWLAEAVRAAGTMYVPAPIHQVRIAAKKLRYTLELARAAHGAAVGRDIAALKRVQDLLGRLRDLQILQEHVHEVASEAARDVALTGAFDAMHTALEAECRTLHADFLKRTNRLTALADRAAREIPASLVVRSTRRMAKARPMSAPRPARSRLRSA